MNLFARHQIMMVVIVLVVALAGITHVANAQVLGPSNEPLVEIGTTISGRITDSRGNGVAGVTVVAMPSGMSGVSDDAGTYRIAYVPRGPTVVIPLAPWNGQGFSPPARPLNLRNSATNVNFTLSDRVIIVVGGRILDRQGNPMRGIPVQCNRRTVTTREGGWYVCPPQRIEEESIVVTPRPRTPMRVEPPSITIAPPRTTLDAHFTVDPELTFVSGRVVAANGQGIGAVTVRATVRFLSEQREEIAVTGPDGSFGFRPLPQGARLTVRAELPGLSPRVRTLTVAGPDPVILEFVQR